MLKSLIFLALISIASVAAVVDINDEFGSDCLFAHNLYRKLHGVPALKLSASLSKLAQSRARELADMEELNVKQNKFHGQALGETVGSVGGFSHYNGISATQLWYSVVSKFDEEGELSSEGASFTQIVWKSTQLVGFGIAKSRSGKFFFVAEYFPSGNIRHKYEDNVFQLTDEELVKPLDCPALSSGKHTTSTHTEVIKQKTNSTQQKKPERITANNAANVVDDVVAVVPKKELDAEVSKVFRTTTTKKTTTVADEVEQGSNVESEEPTTTRQTITTTPVYDYETDVVSTTVKPIVHQTKARTTTEAMNVQVQESVAETTTINVNTITLAPPVDEYDFVDEQPVEKTTRVTTTRAPRTTTEVQTELDETTVTVAPIRHAKTTTIASAEEYDIDYEETSTTTTIATTTKIIRHKVPVETTTVALKVKTTSSAPVTEPEYVYEDEPIVPTTIKTTTTTTTTEENIVDTVVEPKLTQKKARQGRQHHLNRKKIE